MRNLGSALLLLTALLVGSGADATTFVATAQGVLGPGSHLDADGFGLNAGDDVVGLSYRTVYTFTDAIVSPAVTYGYGPRASGAVNAEGTISLISAVFTLNRFSLAVVDNLSGRIDKDLDAAPATGEAVYQLDVRQASPFGSEFARLTDVFGSAGFLSADFREAGTFSSLSGRDYDGVFSNPGVLAGRFDFQLRSQTLAIAAVPEPVCWAMMIAGFGVAGGAVRRRTMVARRA